MKAMSQFYSRDPQRRPNYVKAMEAHLLVILWAASAMADREAKEWIAAHDESDKPLHREATGALGLPSNHSVWR
jgi:hypothetical protein